MTASASVSAYATERRGRNFRARSAGLLGGLVLFNVTAWLWAILAFRAYPTLLGTAALAYTFGLRHAFDADHIAAIDNVTRKFVQNGGRPVGVGFCFSLGHSTIVVALSIAIAATASALQAHFAAFQSVGGVIGTLVSSLFLFLIAAANIVVLGSIWRAFRAARDGGRIDEEDLDLALANRGVMGRLFRRFFRTVSKSWHMYFIGLLFGLGFDTATEVGLLGISATQAAQGLPIWSILVFPALFTAGMTLVDAGDSLLMVSAYGWAFIKPIRKLYYNLTITVISVLVAVAVGGLEALNLIGDQLGLTDNGGFWGTIGTINDNFGTLGYLIVGIFAACWLLSALIYHLKGYDAIETAAD